MSPEFFPIKLIGLLLNIFLESKTKSLNEIFLEILVDFFFHLTQTKAQLLHFTNSFILSLLLSISCLAVHLIKISYSTLYKKIKKKNFKAPLVKPDLSLVPLHYYLILLQFLIRKTRISFCVASSIISLIVFATTPRDSPAIKKKKNCSTPTKDKGSCS